MNGNMRITITLEGNEALKDNGNDAKKVCENFGCVVREHNAARPNYELCSQAKVEAHEEKMEAVQKKLKRQLHKWHLQHQECHNPGNPNEHDTVSHYFMF
ncbi:hypothetical protein B9Z55_028773 [Caenorhabditis nigoni]|uniref:Uncharacterized protein n=1 Tax=Caenorhabditis nigoni TaxID=1611254 RepID=A0A2G5SA15_9PELO|nr:hypothetical protein B9Z55_028773 [Caenorhabditis nigoni]